MIRRSSLSSLTLCAAVAAGLPAAAIAQTAGPSSSKPPYILPLAAGVQTVSVLTVGDSPTGSSYRLVGIPDGMGVYRAPGGFNLILNHELNATQGIVRAHGQAGSFISRWNIQPDLTVLSGEDLIQTAVVNGGGVPLFSRFCSGDLPSRAAFWPLTPAEARIYLCGEESGAEGRAWATIATGPEEHTTYELPALGKFSWENAVARPLASQKTVVVGLDDSTPGQVYVYIGQKAATGTTLQRAGLATGLLYGVKVPGVPLEDRTIGINGATTFELANLGDASTKTGAQIQTDSVTAGVTEFLRPEDGAWDVNDLSVFYFVTTDRFDTPTQVGRSRLWRLKFTDVNQPELGGTIAMLLDGTEGQQMLDNLTIDRHSNLLIQEDPGNQAHLARIWQYTPSTDTLKLLAEHNAAFFITGALRFLTQDEESSGIIDASSNIGPGWFLLNCQAHFAIPGELVEGGQILALFNPDSI